jgi:hypothetical protein
LHFQSKLGKKVHEICTQQEKLGFVVGAIVQTELVAQAIEHLPSWHKREYENILSVTISGE